MHLTYRSLRRRQKTDQIQPAGAIVNLMM